MEPQEFSVAGTGSPMITGCVRDGSVPLKTKEYGIHIGAGDRLEIRSGGGGGWGDPAKRRPEDRARDRTWEFVADEPEPASQSN